MILKEVLGFLFAATRGNYKVANSFLLTSYDNVRKLFFLTSCDNIRCSLRLNYKLLTWIDLTIFESLKAFKHVEQDNTTWSTTMTHFSNVLLLYDLSFHENKFSIDKIWFKRKRITSISTWIDIFYWLSKEAIIEHNSSLEILTDIRDIKEPRNGLKKNYSA